MITGLRYPYIAKYNESTGAYSDGFLANKAVDLVMTPEFNTVEYPGDDVIVKRSDVFKQATVAAKITKLPMVAASVMFGHTVTGLEVKKNANDKANYVGYGYVSTQVNDDGADSYVAYIIPKVKFMDGPETFTTNGSSIAITAPQVDGVALADLNGDWLVTKEFATMAEAKTYVQTYLGILPKIANPIANIPAGAYTGTQSVTLSTATAGATIKYTTNGLTPSSTIGTTYSTAISVAASTMIRAIAFKSGMENSDVISNEYIIS